MYRVLSYTLKLITRLKKSLECTPRAKKILKIFTHLFSFTNLIIGTPMGAIESLKWV